MVQNIAPSQDISDAAATAAPVEACFHTWDLHVALPKYYIPVSKPGCVCKTGAFCCGGGCKAGDESLVLF